MIRVARRYIFVCEDVRPLVRGYNETSQTASLIESLLKSHGEEQVKTVGYAGIFRSESDWIKMFTSGNKLVLPRVLVPVYSRDEMATMVQRVFLFERNLT